MGDEVLDAGIQDYTELFSLGLQGFEPLKLDDEQIKKLQKNIQIQRRDVIAASHIAGSGHPGGALDIIPITALLFAGMRTSTIPETYDEELLEKFVRVDPILDKSVGFEDGWIWDAGHMCLAPYTTLAHNGLIPRKELLTEFRFPGSIVPGHTETVTPTMLWDTGPLSHGTPAANANAFYAHQHGKDWMVWNVLGDGGAQKGNLWEALNFSNKYELGNLCYILDRNKLQIMGRTDEVMDVNYKAEFEAAGLEVYSIHDGEDLQRIYQVLKEVFTRRKDGKPKAIIVKTLMGTPVSFMVDKAQYHGAPTKGELTKRALTELEHPQPEEFLEELTRIRAEKNEELERLIDEKTYEEFLTDKGIEERQEPPINSVRVGPRSFYEPGKKIGMRDEVGVQLGHAADLNNTIHDPQLVVFDCDLGSSTRASKVKDVEIEHKEEANLPNLDRHYFVQGGVTEAHTSEMAAALAKRIKKSIYMTFGAFAIDEIYMTWRQAALNETKNFSVIASHIGFNVGEDGKTHQCVDYLGTLKNLFDQVQVYIPSDANETSAIVQYVIQHDEISFLGLPRSNTPIIAKEDGTAQFGEGYQFQPGKWDVVREGRDGAIIAMGWMVPTAIEVHDILRTKFNKEYRVINASSPTVLDETTIRNAAHTEDVRTLEDHFVGTGLGNSIGQFMSKNEITPPTFKNYGVHRPSGSGMPDYLQIQNGLHPRTIALDIAKKNPKEVGPYSKT